LAREKATEVVAGLDHHRAIAGDVGHGRQRIHLLGPRDTRHHVHRDDGGTLVLAEFQEILVLSRIEKGDQRLGVPQLPRLGGGGRPHFDDDVDLFKQIGCCVHECHAGSFIGRIGKTSRKPSSGFDEARVPDLLQLQGGVRRQRHTRFSLERLFRGSNFHPTSPSQVNQIKN
jgi:hypothetical protein